MFKALENSLFVVDRDKYALIRQRANAFNSNYTGSNIILQVRKMWTQMHDRS